MIIPARKKYPHEKNTRTQAKGSDGVSYWACFRSARSGQARRSVFIRTNTYRAAFRRENQRGCRLLSRDTLKPKQLLTEK